MVANHLLALPEPETGPLNGPVTRATIFPVCRAPDFPAAEARAVLARCAAVIAATVLLVGVSAASDEPATAPVETLHHALIEVMKAGARHDAASRARTLAPVVRGVFDFARLSRIVLGKHRDRLGPGQRARMADTFARYTVANYAARFDAWSGERFETTGTRALKRGRVAVRTLLHLAGGETIRLDYVVRPGQDGWRIVNVVAEGVSELALRRAEYDTLMATGSFETLIGRIERRIAELLEGST